MGATNNLLEDEKKTAQQQLTSDDDILAPPVPPDGGWGWVIVVASLICNIIVDGVCLSFGIFLMSIDEYYEGVSKQETLLVGSSLAGSYLIMGPIASALANKFGCRRVTIVGSVIASSAFFLSTFSPNIKVLVLTYGVMGGIGFGLIYLPAIVIVGFYFERRRAFATGIAVCGSGLGTLLFAPLADYLLEIYHWKGCAMIMSGIVLQCAICGALFRPLESPRRRSKNYRPEKDIPREKIRRGSIFQKIVEEKARQRTISQGSLDGCIITRNNELIKLPPHLRVSQSSNTNINKVSLGGNQVTFDTNSTGARTPPQVKLLQEETQSLRLQRRGTDPNPNVSQLSVSNNLQLGGSLPNSCASSLQFSQSSDLNPWEEQAKIEERKQAKIEELRRELNRPMYRKDILYSGSVAHVAHPYQSTLSATSIPEDQYYTGESIWSCCPSYKAMSDVFRQMLDFSLFKSPTFILLCVSTFLSMLGFFVPFFFIVDYAVQLDVDKAYAIYLLSTVGLTNIKGRILAGFISDRSWADPLWINNIALVICGVGTVFCPFCTTFAHLVIYSAVYGLCIAAFISLRSIIVVELMGLEKLTNAFGILILFQGIASFVGTPICGWLYDVTNSYDMTFYVSGSVLALSGILCFPLRSLSRWEKSKQRQECAREPEYVHVENVITSV